MNQKNEYYSNTINEFYVNKDSVIEMAKVIDFDTERLVAKVYTLTSKQYLEDVPVFFSSMYMNTGIISPPAKNSSSLLFWGPDRQPFLMPVQFNVPSIFIENGKTKLNASPGMVDALLTLKNIKPGEHLLRSLGGAYIFLKNMGEVEIGTSRMHRMTLSPKDGSFSLQQERIRWEVNNSQLYFGPASYDSTEDKRTHFYFDLSEDTDENNQLSPEITNQELLDRVLADEVNSIDLLSVPKIYTVQMGHVFDESDEVVTDPVDGTELFSKTIMSKEDTEVTEQLSKGGRKVFRTKSGNRQTTIEIAPTTVNLEVETTVDGVKKVSQLGIDEKGNIVCSQNGETLELWPMLKWYYDSIL